MRRPSDLRKKRAPNSWSQPMRGLSLARRFRGSDIATLRVALPERTGRARLNQRVVSRTTRIESKVSQQLRRSNAQCRSDLQDHYQRRHVVTALDVADV